MTATALWCHPTPLVLASGSAARRAMLEACAIPLEIEKPDLDEATLAAGMIASGKSPRDIALALACAKAGEVAAHLPARLVLAADQTQDLDGALFMKPTDMAAARAQLLALRGRTHHLHSAAALYQESRLLWSGTASASLTMRAFSDGFLDAYLAAMGAAALTTVGGYQIEALGPHLFETVNGGHATILGLPLPGVLAALREAGALLG